MCQNFKVEVRSVETTIVVHSLLSSSILLVLVYVVFVMNEFAYRSVFGVLVDSFDVGWGVSFPSDFSHDV